MLWFVFAQTFIILKDTSPKDNRDASKYSFFVTMLHKSQLIEFEFFDVLLQAFVEQPMLAINLNPLKGQLEFQASRVW
jgi:hypothetical protein